MSMAAGGVKSSKADVMIVWMFFLTGLASGHVRPNQHASCQCTRLERALLRRLLARRRAAVQLELSDSELYEKLRERVDSLDPELRRELTENPWDGLCNRYPISSEFVDAMREIETQKRIRRRNVTASAMVAAGLLLIIMAYAASSPTP